jgi:hypothetical protein
VLDREGLIDLDDLGLLAGGQGQQGKDNNSRAHQLDLSVA